MVSRKTFELDVQEFHPRTNRHLPVQNDPNGYAKISDGGQYSIFLHNKDYMRKAKVDISIDGKFVMTLVLEKGQAVRLERPPGSEKRFTWVSRQNPLFYIDGQHAIAPENYGLIKASFVPELAQPFVLGAVKSLETTRGGRTVLSGHVEDFPVNDSDRVNLYLRLETKPEDKVEPLTNGIPPIR